ncbi:MAG: hypothetical protein RI580_13375, partial [Halothece sp. Uz-M2-17]|nr:hypothetical protein [Halothece sp. Uz-M2-17]
MPSPGFNPEEKYINLGTYNLPNHKWNFSNDYKIERVKIDLEEYRYYGKIVGNSKGNTIIGNVEDESIRGKKGDDTLKGAKGEDRLYGGNGEDRLYGGRGYDKLYGRNGDDFLMGGMGDDTLRGGTGNDILKGAKGTDKLYGSEGNDFLSSGPLRGDQEDTLNGGSGADTFLLGEADSGNTNTGGINWANLGLSLAGDITDLVFTGLPGSQLTKEVVPMVFDVFKEGLSVNSASNSTPPAKSSQAQIEDFNPVEDVVIIPLQPQGSPNVFISNDTNGTGSDISLKYSENNSTDIFATLEFDPPEVLDNNSAASNAFDDYFQKYLEDSALIIDSSNASLGLSQQTDLNVDDSKLENLGTSKFLILGAYSGKEVKQSVYSDPSDYRYGTNFGDVLYGYTDDPHLDTNSDKMYGFDGDDLFFGGAGKDFIYGGQGSDTASFDTEGVKFGINIDFTNNGNEVTNDGYGNQDNLDSIENIIGTKHNDTIKGDDKNNTFTGLGGNDTLDGGDGQDTAIFSGDYDDYTITAHGSGFNVEDPDGTGTDYLENIEQFKFGDGSTYDVESEQVLKNIGEYGQVSINHEWETIELDQSYSNPVVIASDPTYNGSDPATVRIKNVENDSFELRLQEPKNEDGKHPFEEDVSYVVIEEGDWELADGTRLSASNYNSGKLTSQGFETVDLTGFDNKPTVLSQVQTYNGGDWVTTRTKNQTASDFKLAMQEEEARNGGGHYEENIG